MNSTSEDKRKYFDDLPDEITIKIFSYLDIDDLASVSDVNSHWREMSQDNSIWKGIIYTPKPNVTNKERIDLIQKIPALRAYSALFTENISLVMDAICTYCKQFKHLHLSGGHDLTYPLLQKFLHAFPDIERLDIPVLKQENPLIHVQLISKLEKLTDLRFSDRYADVYQQVLKAVAEGCPSLVHMNFGDNKFKDEDMRYFLQKKQNQLLYFELWCPISPTTFKYLTECSNLEELNFNTFNYCSNLSIDDMLLLKKLNKLKKLKLGYMTAMQAMAVSKLFTNQSLSNVVELNLTCLEITEKDLTSVILNCPQIINLTICGLSIKLDEALRRIGNCRNLKLLSLSGCTHVTSECIDLVAEGCPLLEYLNLSCSLETKDDVILSVLKLKELRSICISYGGFSGKHFDLFPKYLIHLREIIAYETGICDIIWDRLLEEIPCLKIIGREWEDH